MLLTQALLPLPRQTQTEPFRNIAEGMSFPIEPVASHAYPDIGDVAMTQTLRPGKASSLMRNRLYRKVWLASNISTLGTLVQSVGAAWLMTSLTADPVMIALVQSSMALPLLLVAPAAGVLADVYDRRRLILLAQASMMAVALMLSVLAKIDGLSSWGLLALTFLIGCGTAAGNPSLQASIPDFVPRHAVADAVALNSIGYNVMRSFGPAAGGALVATGGAALAFCANALSYLPLLFVIGRWRSPERSRLQTGFLPALADGIRHLFKSGPLRRAVFRSGLFGVSAIAVTALLPLAVKSTFEGGPMTYGFLLGAFGIGGVIGGTAAMYFRRRSRIEALVRVGFGASALGMLTLAVAPSVILATPGLISCGAGWVLVMSTLQSMVQLVTPPALVGRMIALHQSLSFGCMAAGAWFWGSVADLASISVAFTVAATIAALGGIFGLIIPVCDIDDTF